MTNFLWWHNTIFQRNPRYLLYLQFRRIGWLNGRGSHLCRHSAYMCPFLLIRVRHLGDQTILLETIFQVNLLWLDDFRWNLLLWLLLWGLMLLLLILDNFWEHLFLLDCLMRRHDALSFDGGLRLRHCLLVMMTWLLL